MVYKENATLLRQAELGSDRLWENRPSQRAHLYFIVLYKNQAKSQLNSSSCFLKWHLISRCCIFTACHTTMSVTVNDNNDAMMICQVLTWM